MSIKSSASLLSTLPIMVGFLVISGREAKAGVCPAVGADTDCGVLITVTNSGAYPSSTGQGPYDGDDDTLVGVVNNSKLPISSLGLSGSGIFGFDGDGIDTYGILGNSQDSSGYGGSNAYFVNITSDLISGVTSGDVNFLMPIAPGGTGYFSLETNLNLDPSCQQVVDNSVAKSIETGLFSDQPNRPSILATFTPQLSLSISQAAVACGFKNFDWEQIITNLPAPSPFKAVGSNIPLTAPPAFNDPPPGGYQYQDPPNNAYPFYYNLFTPASDPLSLAYNEPGGIDGNILNFFDSPKDPFLPAGQQLAFTTQLVGVLPDNSLQPLGIGFSWTDTWNGTSGDISTQTAFPADSGNGIPIASGAGDITITGETNTTTYNYFGGLTIDAINGIANGPTYSDNVVVASATAVPEPSSDNLLTTLGFLGIWLSFKRRKLSGDN